jgi:D-alanyl-lipoteichoic acid acyltransferase DltB (MBOAT superfamily)
MLFNSIEFLIFLPIVFLLYWFVFKKRSWQNLLIVVASYVFYGWWDWRFLILIAITSLCSFLSGILLEKNEGRQKIQKAINATVIVINLGILGVFKYYNFFAGSLNTLIRNLFGYDLGWTTLEIILPVGISFYTFQALCYSIDIYRHNIRATHDPIEFFAYISFFPQLVAGPIERATNLLPQFQKDRHFEYSEAVDGLRQMLWGFFKKLVIADNCAAIVNQHWDSFDTLPGVMLITLGVLFTFQIYCDFSGYSDIAIGCARLFGMELMRNFNYPYFSRSIPEFWRRWHISLTTWFRDYIYFPLGGSRGSKWTTIRNVFIVWAISGLWHGADWTFVCWGLFHAVILNIYNVFGIRSKYEHDVAQGRLFPNIKEFGQITLTFSLAVIGWILFRAESMPQAADYFSAMINNPFLHGTEMPDLSILYICALFFIAEWFQRDKQHVLQFPDRRIFRYRAVRWCIYYILIIVIIAYTGKSQDFIYFQF